MLQKKPESFTHVALICCIGCLIAGIVYGWSMLSRQTPEPQQVVKEVVSPAPQPVPRAPQYFKFPDPAPRHHIHMPFLMGPGGPGGPGGPLGPVRPYWRGHRTWTPQSGGYTYGWPSGLGPAGPNGPVGPNLPVGNY